MLLYSTRMWEYVVIIFNSVFNGNNNIIIMSREMKLKSLFWD